MLFYLDENVPASVQTILEKHEHKVFWTRDILALGAPDDLVAAIAQDASATLISHDKDFKKIAARIPNGEKARFRKLNMIRLMCKKPRSAERLSKCLPFIELDYSIRKNTPDKRSIIEIKTDLVSIWT